MTEHEYKFITATPEGFVTIVNGVHPDPPKKVWDLVNSLGATGWRVVHVTPIGLLESDDAIWVVLHRESHGPEPL